MLAHAIKATAGWGLSWDKLLDGVTQVCRSRSMEAFLASVGFLLFWFGEIMVKWMLGLVLWTITIYYIG